MNKILYPLNRKRKIDQLVRVDQTGVSITQQRMGRGCLAFTARNIAVATVSMSIWLTAVGGV